MFDERSRRWRQVLIAAPLVIALIFLIVSVSLSSLFTTSVEQHDLVNGVDAVGTSRLGAFSFCNDAEYSAPGQVVSQHGCSEISPSCGFTNRYTENGVAYSQSLQLQDVVPDFSCGEFNVFRAFFVLSILLTAAGLAAVLLLFRTADKRVVKPALSLLVCQTAALAVAWIVAVDSFSRLPAPAGYSKGAAFWLAVTAWVVAQLSIAALLHYRRHDPLLQDDTRPGGFRALT